MRSRSRQSASGDRAVGTWYALAAFGAWGVLPLYWKALKAVPPVEILAHRILWSFVFLVVMTALRQRFPEIRKGLARPADRVRVLLSSALICFNWLLFIWAINSGHVVDASLGYFINPLINVLLGVLFFSERLSGRQKFSILLAAGGVAVLTVWHGRFPWIGLALALSFAGYGVLRKVSRLEAVPGLLAETAILSPVMLILVTVGLLRGTGATGRVPLEAHLLLIGAGLVTASPLVWFVMGVRRIPLSLIGFIQYLSPSIQFVLGVFVFGEVFMGAQALGFGLIWAALLIFSLSNTAVLGRRSLAQRTAAALNSRGGVAKDE